MASTRRSYRWMVLAALAIGCLLSAPVASLAAQMAARLDRETIYLGTQTLLVVEVADVASNDWPVIAPVDGLQITHYGLPSTMRDLFSGSVQRTYRFLVNPLRAGTFTIPPVTLGAGAETLTQGPFTLRVLEAALKFVSAKVEPPELRPGESATVTITYQGVRPGKNPAIPVVNGLIIRPAGGPRVEITRPEGLPISTYQLQVTASQLGTYQIKGFALDNVPAEAVTLKVLPFVIAGTQVSDPSLVVGGQTLVHVLVRGLPQSAGVKLVAPAGLTIQPAGQQYHGPAGATVFSFEVTATEPGSPTIKALQLADGRQVPLPKPITLSVRQSGEGDILACRASVRSEQTILGEPFIVDYEVFFRGDLQAAGIDLSQAEFANRPYIKVEPVSELSYPNWAGQPIEVGMSGQRRARVLSGSGELNGRKEQLLRFAFKITPLAAGELELKGVRVVLQLASRQEQRTGGMFFQSMQTRDYDRLVEAPPHRVVDPPGKAQPAGYRGAVGTTFTYSAALDRTTATAMSPLSLTLKIAGESVGPQFKPPPVGEIPEVSRDFDVSPTVGGGEVQGNTITFTQVVRPRSETVKELPALPLVYYDYLKKEYQTVYSLPIAITVTPGSLVGATAMQTRSGPEAPPPDSRGARPPAEEIISLGANYTTLGELQAGAPLGAGGVLAVLIAGPCAILALWAGRRWHERRRPLAARRRQQRELAAALERISGDAFYVQLAELVQSYLRLRFGLPAGEISAGSLGRAMDGRAPDDGVQRHIAELLTCCDTGRFAVGTVDHAEKDRLLNHARQLFARLDRL